MERNRRLFVATAFVSAIAVSGFYGLKPHVTAQVETPAGQNVQEEVVALDPGAYEPGVAIRNNQVQYRALQSKVVLSTVENAEANVLGRLPAGSRNRSVVSRLITHRDVMSFVGASLNYDMPGSPSPSTPVWMVSVLAEGEFPPNAFGGFDPSEGSSRGGWLAVNAGNGEPVAFSNYTGGIEPHAQIEKLVSKDLPILPLAIIVGESRP